MDDNVSCKILAENKTKLYETSLIECDKNAVWSNNEKETRDERSLQTKSTMEKHKANGENRWNWKYAQQKAGHFFLYSRSRDMWEEKMVCVCYMMMII